MQDAARTIRFGGARRSECRGRVMRQVAMSVGLVAITSMSVLGTDVTTRPAAADGAGGPEVIVRLHTVGVVSGEQVTLGDVAEISGDSAGLAASCPITPSPKPGHSLLLSLDDVQKALSDRGANLAHWTFRGSSRCSVSRTNRRDNDSKTGLPHSADQGETAKTQSSRIQMPEARFLQHAAPAIEPNTLGGVIHDYIRKRLADLGGEPTLQFPKTFSTQLEFSRPTYDFRVLARGEQLLGMVSLEVGIVDANHEQQTLQVPVRVSLRKAVVTAGRVINRGKVVETGDLTMQEQVFERIEDIGLSDARPVIGQQAKRFIDKGERLLAKDFEPLPLVHRNDLVTVLITRGNLRVKGTARALGSGAFGEVVEVRNEMADRSAGKFPAVVVGDKTVEIPASGRATSTAPAGRGDL